jgi:FixJ family two-component response regulator
MLASMADGRDRPDVKPSFFGFPERLQRRGKLVLAVVDDDEDIRSTLARLLRACGHEVRLFDSAEPFLKDNFEADCAILDVRLPGISGLELEERLRQQGRRMPVVFITAHDDVATRSAIQKSRRYLLMKPFDDDDLLAAIAEATDTPL